MTESPSANGALTHPGPGLPRELPWHGRLLAALIYALIRAVALTIRFRYVDRSGLIAVPDPPRVIFSTWHNRLALALIVYKFYVQKHGPGRRMATIVSASRDGALVTGVLRRFGVEPARGSTSRRGTQALRELTTWAERGYDLSITPDGPRGPRYHVQEGAIALARLTGLPIVFMTYHLDWKITLKSWDRFQVPIPFARCRVTLGAPLRVGRDAGEGEREELRARLEREMITATED